MWGNSYFDKIKGNRLLRFNTQVAMCKNQLDKVVKGFDVVFGGQFTDFTDEIASVQLYPFEIPTRYNTNVKYLYRRKGIVKVDGEPVEALDTVDVDFFYLGSYKIENYFNNFADFNNYTNLLVYLPFFDFVDVNINDCLGKYLNFLLSVDYYTGQGIYIIAVSDTAISYNTGTRKSGTSYNYIYASGLNNSRIIGKYGFQLSINCPVGQSNFSDLVRNTVLNTVKTIGNVAITALTGVPTATTRSQSTSTTTTKSRGDSGRLVTTDKETIQEDITVTREIPVSKSKPVSELFNNSIDVLNSTKPSGSGDRVGNPMLNIIMSPYIHLIFYRPKIKPSNDYYRHLFGVPLGETRTLNTLRGYTEISAIHIEGDGFNKATEVEKNLIESMLSSGVILPDTSLRLETMYIDNQKYNFSSEVPVWSDWVNSFYNYSRFSVSNNKIISINGDFVRDANGVEVLASDTILPYASYFTTQDTPTEYGVFNINNRSYNYTVGMTWDEWINSSYNTALVRIENGLVISSSGTNVKLDGVNVNSIDIITESNYTYNYRFSVDNTYYECYAGQNWNEFISTFSPSNFRIADTKVYVGNDVVYNILNNETQYSNSVILDGTPYGLRVETPEVDPSQLINFTIDGTTYSAPSDNDLTSSITVDTWTHTIYNTGGFKFDNILLNASNKPVLNYYSTDRLSILMSFSPFIKNRAYEVGTNFYITDISGNTSTHYTTYLFGWSNWVASTAGDTSVNNIGAYIDTNGYVCVENTENPEQIIYLKDSTTNSKVTSSSFIHSERTYIMSIE